MSALAPAPLRPRVPQMGMFGPEWFHHHGSKMSLDKSPQQRHFMRIAASAAWLQISPVSNPGDDGWYIDWEIRQSLLSKTSGRVVFPTPILRAAFGLYDTYTPETNQWLIERFGGDCADQGRYIRYQRHLNIPGPGTGHDGDANISILLDDNIIEAIRRLIMHRPLS